MSADFSEYRYIYQPDSTIPVLSGDVLNNNYSRDEICEKFVTRYESNKKSSYRVFQSQSKFLSFLEACPEEQRCYHEVIFGWQKQKLKFDLDMEMPAIDAFQQDSSASRQEKANEILNVVLESITDMFFMIYFTDCDILICNSSSKDKFSYHIIITSHYVNDCTNAKMFTKNVLNAIPRGYKQFVDHNVNKQTQNFRMVNCHKAKSNRFKRIYATYEDNKVTLIPTKLQKEYIELTIITDVSKCVELPSRVEETVNKTHAEFTADDIDRILEIAAANVSDFSSHRMNKTNGRMITFMRSEPSYCEVCERTHHTDNSMILFAPINDNVCDVFLKCRRNANDQSHHIGNFLVANEGAPGISVEAKTVVNWSTKLLKGYISKIDDGYSLYPGDPIIGHVTNSNIYCNKQLAEFEHTKTLLVRAAMKMGKTKKLRDHINQYYNGTLQDPKIIFISFRQTFSSDIKKKFPDFVMYNEVKGPLTQKRLIVQVESLHRLTIDELPDLVILDECESIFEQFDSGLLKNFNASFAKFQYLMRYSKHLICMDAGMSMRSYNIVSTMRSHDVFYHCNNYKNATDDNYHVTANISEWLYELHSCIDRGEKIAVPMSSLSEATALLAIIEKKHPELADKIKLYSSKTSAVEKKAHFASVDDFWSQYDVMIYTPTVSAGVSFEREHFDKVFAYFTDKSCPVETCIQMIGRIRNVKSKQLYICLNSIRRRYPTDIEEIKQNVYDMRSNLYKNINETYLQFEYTAEGRVKYYANDYFTIWLENTRMKHISLNEFAKKFIHMVVSVGAKCTLMSTEANPNQLDDILIEHTSKKTEIKYLEDKAIAESRELNLHEVEDIRDKFLSDEYVTDEDTHAYDKFRLRRGYNYTGNISVDFVSDYRKAKTMRIFKNYQRLAAEPTLDEALKRIQGEEQAHYRYVMDNADKTLQYNDMNRKYVFEQHRIALGFLRVCGFETLTDTNYKSTQSILENLRGYKNTIIGLSRSIVTEFGINPPVFHQEQNDKLFIKSAVRYINKILLLMYGVRIKIDKAMPICSLEPCKLFYTDSAERKIAIDNGRVDKPVISPDETQLFEDVLGVVSTENTASIDNPNIVKINGMVEKNNTTESVKSDNITTGSIEKFIESI